MCVCQSEGQLSVKLSPDSLGSVSWAAVGLSDTFPLEVEVWKCVGGRVCEGGHSHATGLFLCLTPVHRLRHTHPHKDNLDAFILFSPLSVLAVSDTVNLSQFPPLIIIKKRKLLHSPLNTPTCLLLLLALQLLPRRRQTEVSRQHSFTPPRLKSGNKEAGTFHQNRKTRCWRVFYKTIFHRCYASFTARFHPSVGKKKQQKKNRHDK